MALSSIHFAKASDGGLNHNDRTEKTEPEYLLPLAYRLENVFDFSAQDAAKNLRDLYAAAKVNYKKVFGQKLQAKNYTWEAVVNLNKEHDLSAVKKLVSEIEKKTGFQSVQIAIHRDEGHLKKIKDGTEIPIYNLHAHITFFTLDQKNGKQLMRQDIPPRERKLLREEIIKNNPNLQGEKNKKEFNKEYQRLRAERYQVFDREKLSELQDLTAKVLNMERGKKGSKAQRLEHKQYKAVKKQEQKTKNQTLAKQKDLKAEISDLREELQALGADRASYAKLEAENKELKELIKQKDLTNEELQKRLAEHLSDFKREDKDFIATRVGNPSKSKIATSLRIKKDIIGSSFQEKVFFKHYQHSVRENLKGFYIDTSRTDGKVILSHKEKKIKIIDTGEKIIASGENKELQAQVKIMLDIAQAKEWNLLTLDIEGSKEFKKEVTKQVSELLKKNIVDNKDDSDFRATRSR